MNINIKKSILTGIYVFLISILIEVEFNILYGAIIGFIGYVAAHFTLKFYK